MISMIESLKMRLSNNVYVYADINDNRREDLILSIQSNLFNLDDFQHTNELLLSLFVDENFVETHHLFKEDPKNEKKYASAELKNWTKKNSHYEFSDAYNIVKYEKFDYSQAHETFQILDEFLRMVLLEKNSAKESDHQLYNNIIVATNRAIYSLFKQHPRLANNNTTVFTSVKKFVETA